MDKIIDECKFEIRTQNAVEGKPTSVYREISQLSRKKRPPPPPPSPPTPSQKRLWTVAGVVRKALHNTVSISFLRKTFQTCAVQHDRHLPRVAIESLKCGESECAIVENTHRFEDRVWKNECEISHVKFYIGCMLKLQHLGYIGLNKVHY